MRNATRSSVMLVALAASITLSPAVHAAPAPRDAKGFAPLFPYMGNAAWTVADAVKSGGPEGRLAPRTAPLVVDLAKGSTPGACSFKDAWTGQATYLNSDVGTIQYWGMGRGCHADGLGTIQYADGSTYFGFVETLVRDNDFEGTDVVLRRDDSRVAMRFGPGQFTDARTGRVQVGKWEGDRLAQDLSGDAAFIALLQAALASVQDRAAPQYTIALLDWDGYQTDADRAATVAYEQAQAAQKAANAAVPKAVPAHELRGRTNAEAAKDPTRIPQPILDAHPDLAKLLPVLQAYGNAQVAGAPFVDENLFGMVSCKQKNTEDARWTDKRSGTAYLGGHKGCFPKDSGRIRLANGIEWIGRVANRVMLPHPNGLGELRTTEGARVFMRVRYEEVGGTRQILGYALADGRVIVVPEAKVENISFSDHITILNDLASRAARVQRFDIQYPNGAIVSATLQPTSGRFEARGYNDDRADQFSIPELGVRFTGENVGTAEQAAYEARAGQKSGTTAGDAGKDVARDGRWKGYIFVTLEKEYRGLPPGRYFRELPESNDTSLRNGIFLIGDHLIPRDAQTIAALGPNPGRCKRAFPAAELPKGWVAWWPSCFSNAVRAYSPDGAFFLSFGMDAEGKITKRMLVQTYQMAGSVMHRTWEADRFVVRNGMVVPEGVAVYSASWGKTVVERTVGSGTISHNGYGADDSGAWFVHYFGPMNGLVPNGSGRCRPPNARVDQTEACEFRDGARIDPAHQQRVQQHRQQVAQQRAAQQKRDRQEAAKRKAEEEQAALLAAQEEHEAKMRKLQEEQEDAEAEAASQASWAAWLNQKQAENAKFAQDMQATQDQYNQAVAAAKQQQAAQQQAARQGPPPGTYDAAKEAADEQAYQAKLAAQKKAYADAYAAQPAPPSAPRSSGSTSGATGGASGGGYSAPSPAASGGSALPKPDTAKIDRCAKLSRDIMSAGSDFHCNMNGKEFPTLGARRDAENACYAEVAAKVAPLKAQYKDECSSSPTDGGVTRY